jgi:CheY-like chemotaxis protein
MHTALDDLLARLYPQYSALAQHKGIDLSMAGNALVVATDPLLLERMLRNLLSNAIQYTEAGTIRVRAVPDGNQVVLEVEDSGIGIAARYHGQVFEEFFQVDNPERDRRKGLGMGLAIVRRLAEILDHPLSFTSEEGRGSCFRLRLPMGDAQKIEPVAPVPPPALDILSGCVVLLIEDDRASQQSTQDLLRRWGCQVWTAADPEEAAATARRVSPDAAIVDLWLRGGSSGMDAIDAVRTAANKPLPALIVTGDMSFPATRADRCAVLHKPVRPAQLRAALSQLIASRNG